MDKVFKIHSVESEDLTQAQNVLNFDIPAGEVLDLSKSYVALKARVTGSNNEANHANAIMNVNIPIDQGGSDFDSYQHSVSLIKNARMTSQMAGRLEELRDVNVIRNFESNVYKHQTVYLGNEYENFMPLRTYEDYGCISPLVDVSAENIVSTARYIDKTVKIPLSDILNIGKVKLFDTGRLGSCRLNIEVDMNRLGAGGDGVTAEADNYDPAHFTTRNRGTLLNSAVAGAVTSAVLARGGGAAAMTYDNDYQEHIPYYVGMPVVVASGDLDGVAYTPRAVKTTITDIAYDGTSGRVTLSFSNSLGTIAAAGTADVKLSPLTNAEVTTKTFTLGQAELVAYSVGSNNRPSPMPTQISYTHYTVERDFVNAENFKRQYELEADAINAIVLPKEASDDIFPDRLCQEGTRVSIDNELTTDRQVFPHTPLYYHKLNMLALNQGRTIQNVMGKDYSHLLAPNGDDNQDRGGLNVLSYVVEPLKLSNNMKLFEVDMERTAASGAINSIAIYKERVKTI